MGTTGVCIARVGTPQATHPTPFAAVPIYGLSFRTTAGGEEPAFLRSAKFRVPHPLRFSKGGSLGRLRHVQDGTPLAIHLPSKHPVKYSLQPSIIGVGSYLKADG